MILSILASYELALRRLERALSSHISHINRRAYRAGKKRSTQA